MFIYNSLFLTSVLNLSATTVTLKMVIGGKPRILSVYSARPLNTAVWHYVQVDFGVSEVRLRVDLQSGYLSWNANENVGENRGKLYLGGFPEYVRQKLITPCTSNSKRNLSSLFYFINHIYRVHNFVFPILFWVSID